MPNRKLYVDGTATRSAAEGYTKVVLSWSAFEGLVLLSYPEAGGDSSTPDGHWEAGDQVGQCDFYIPFAKGMTHLGSVMDVTAGEYIAVQVVPQLRHERLTLASASPEGVTFHRRGHLRTLPLGAFVISPYSEWNERISIGGLQFRQGMPMGILLNDPPTEVWAEIAAEYAEAQIASQLRSTTIVLDGEEYALAMSTTGMAKGSGSVWTKVRSRADQVGRQFWGDPETGGKRSGLYGGLFTTPVTEDSLRVNCLAVMNSHPVVADSLIGEFLAEPQVDGNGYVLPITQNSEALRTGQYRIAMWPRHDPPTKVLAKGMMERVYLDVSYDLASDGAQLLADLCRYDEEIAAMVQGAKIDAVLIVGEDQIKPADHHKKAMRPDWVWSAKAGLMVEAQEDWAYTSVDPASAAMCVRLAQALSHSSDSAKAAVKSLQERWSRNTELLAEKLGLSEEDPDWGTFLQWAQDRVPERDGTIEGSDDERAELYGQLVLACTSADQLMGMAPTRNWVTSKLVTALRRCYAPRAKFAYGLPSYSHWRTKRQDGDVVYASGLDAEDYLYGGTLFRFPVTAAHVFVPVRVLQDMQSMLNPGVLFMSMDTGCSHDKADGDYDGDMFGLISTNREPEWTDVIDLARAAEVRLSSKPLAPIDASNPHGFWVEKADSLRLSDYVARAAVRGVDTMGQDTLYHTCTLLDGKTSAPNFVDDHIRAAMWRRVGIDLAKFNLRGVPKVVHRMRREVANALGESDIVKIRDAWDRSFLTMSAFKGALFEAWDDVREVTTLNKKVRRLLTGPLESLVLFECRAVPEFGQEPDSAEVTNWPQVVINLVAESDAGDGLSPAVRKALEQIRRQLGSRAAKLSHMFQGLKECAAKGRHGRRWTKSMTTLRAEAMREPALAVREHLDQLVDGFARETEAEVRTNAPSEKKAKTQLRLRMAILAGAAWLESMHSVWSSPTLVTTNEDLVQALTWALDNVQA